MDIVRHICNLTSLLISSLFFSQTLIKSLEASPGRREFLRSLCNNYSASCIFMAWLSFWSS